MVRDSSFVLSTWARKWARASNIDDSHLDDQVSNCNTTRVTNVTVHGIMRGIVTEPTQQEGLNVGKRPGEHINDMQP